MGNFSSLLENAMFAAGPIGSILAVRNGLSTWMKFEIATSMGFGIAMILRPDIMLSNVMKTPLETHHYFLAGLLGAQLVNIVLYPLFVRDSKDESVHYGHFLARTIEHSFITMDNIMAYLEGNHYNYKMLCFFTSVAITQLGINIYCLSKTPRPTNQKKRYDVAGLVGKLDFYVHLLTGVALYAFPDRINPLIGGASLIVNESHRSLTRTTGAFLIGTSLAGYSLSEFKDDEDKKKFLLSRITGYLVELGIIVAGFSYGAYPLKTMVGLTAVNMACYMPYIYGYTRTQLAIDSSGKTK